MPPSASSSPTPSATLAPPRPQGSRFPLSASLSRPANPSRRPVQVQPATVRLSPAGLRTLPYRLTHPPPLPQHAAETNAQSKRKARWWRWPTIQPYFDVRLDDVLARKYLPPLGLKDFEEWLLFVEGKEENLYFILWLREYTAQYNAWMSSFKGKTPATPATHGLSFTAPSDHDQSPREQPFASLGLAASTLAPSPHQPGTSRGPRRPDDSGSDEEQEERRSRRSYASATHVFPPPNHALSMFYMRAKVTFLTPAAPYELDVPSDVLSPFHTGQANQNAPHSSAGNNPYASLRNLNSPAGPRPPDPVVFAELAEIIEGRLKESLQRLVVATYNNVGMQRAYCGNAGGIVIGTVLSAPPLIAAFSLHAARWWRIFALPGMWLGMTIFISALYGVCMMIYIFGDLRQLRSFELLRPSIKVLSPPEEMMIEKTAVEERRGSIRSSATTPLPKLHDGSPPSPVKSIQTARKFSVPSAFPLQTFGASRKMSMPLTSAERSNAEATSRGLTKDELERMRGDWNRPLTRPPALRINTSSPTRIRQSGRDVGSRSESVDESHEARDPRLEGLSPPSRVHLEDAESESEDEGYTSSSTLSSISSVESDVAPTDTRFSPHHQHRSRRDRRRRQRRPPRIEISDAIIEEHPSPEGPATAPELLWQSTSSSAPPRVVDPFWPDYRPPSVASERDGQTAAFIPQDLDQSEVERDARARAENLRRTSQDVEKGPRSPTNQAHQGASSIGAGPAFDFDGLPPRRCGGRRGSPGRKVHWWTPWSSKRVNHRSVTAPPPEPVVVPPGTPIAPSVRRPPSPSSASEVGSAIAGRGTTWIVRTWWMLLERLQSHCSPDNAADVLKPPQNPDAAPEAPRTPQATFAVPQVAQREHATPSPTAHRRPAKKSMWRLGIRSGYLAAPAFAAPLTPVLDPLVGRAQWEIVVRSAVLSAVVSTLVVAGIVGIPE